jgi:hypothetical protein
VDWCTGPNLTKANVHVALTADASCWWRKDYHYCEPFRVWAEGDERPWAGLSPLGVPGFREGPVHKRKNITQLPIVALQGSWFLLESFAFVANFAHCLFQFLPKLAVFQRMPPSTGLLVPRHRLTPFVVDYLALLNITRFTVLEAEHHYVVQNLTASRYIKGFSLQEPEVLDMLRAPALQHALGRHTHQHRDRSSRIYLRRDLASGSIAHAAWQLDSAGGGKDNPSERLIENEEELTATLEQQGFLSVRMASMSLVARVALLSDLDCLVTQSGANEFNLLFARAQPSRVVVIEAGRGAGSAFWRSQLAVTFPFVMQNLWPLLDLILFPTSGRSNHVNVSALIERVQRPHRNSSTNRTLDSKPFL